MPSVYLRRALGTVCAAVALWGGMVTAQSLNLPRKMPAVVVPRFESRSVVRTGYEKPIDTNPPVFELPQTPRTVEIITVQAIEPIPDQFISGGQLEMIDPTPSSSSVEMIDTPTPQHSTQYIEGPPGETTEFVQEGTPDSFPIGEGASFDGAMMGGFPGEDCGGCGECEACQECEDCWTCQVLPTGIIYHSYLAGPKEPRFAAVFFHDKRLGWQLDYTVGGRVGLVRYGNTANILPQGWQLDLEGAAFPRVNLEENMDLDAADYRVGIPLTYGKDRWQAKVAVYHLSAHVGDEFLIRNPNFVRRNYVRDAFVGGLSCYPVNLLRVYGEAEWAFNQDGGAKPFAFQLGLEASPKRYNGCAGDPFLAVNWSIRQDVDWGGNLCLQLGWQWRGIDNQRLLRTGFHFLSGKSNQFEFMRQNETQVGVGAWYDF